MRAEALVPVPLNFAAAVVRDRLSFDRPAREGRAGRKLL